MNRFFNILAAAGACQELNVHVVEPAQPVSEFFGLRGRAAKNLRSLTERRALIEEYPGIASGVRAQTTPSAEFHLFPPQEDTQNVLRSIEATKRIHEELQKASIEHVLRAFQ